MESSKTPQVNTASKNFSFIKRKGFGRATYLTIRTKTEVKDDVLYVEVQNKHFGIFKGKFTSYNIKLSDISSVALKTSWNFWYSIYGAIFLVIGFIAPPLFILSAIFFFCAYGKTIEILTKQNFKPRIQTETLKDVKEFIDIVYPYKG